MSHPGDDFDMYTITKDPLTPVQDAIWWALVAGLMVGLVLAAWVFGW